MVYFFDTWLRNIKKRLDLLENANIVGQFHDEVIIVCLKSQKEDVENILKQAIKEANEQIKLNVEIGISIDWGNNYSEVH